MRILKIGMTGITAGCGVSVMTAAFAQYLASERKVQVTVCEPFRTSLFDGLGMEKRFAARTFTGFLPEDGAIAASGVRNLHQNINWLLRTPADQKRRLAWRELLRLLYALEGEVVLVDFSGIWDVSSCPAEVTFADYWELLGELARTVLLVDPLPSRMLAGHELLMKLRLSPREFLTVVNKYNAGVSGRELTSYLKQKPAALIPHVNPALLYEAEYAGKSLYELPAAKEVLKPAFRKLEEALFR